MEGGGKEEGKGRGEKERWEGRAGALRREKMEVREGRGYKGGWEGGVEGGEVGREGEREKGGAIGNRRREEVDWLGRESGR